MLNKNIGRPPKVDYKTMKKLADALENGASVKEACNYASISRDTYYRYLNGEDVFANRMQAARKKKKLLFEFKVF